MEKRILRSLLMAVMLFMGVVALSADLDSDRYKILLDQSSVLHVYTGIRQTDEFGNPFSAHLNMTMVCSVELGLWRHLAVSKPEEPKKECFVSKRQGKFWLKLVFFHKVRGWADYGGAYSYTYDLEATDEGLKIINNKSPRFYAPEGFDGSRIGNAWETDEKGENVELIRDGDTYTIKCRYYNGR